MQNVTNRVKNQLQNVTKIPKIVLKIVTNSQLENTIYGVIENNEPIAIAAHKGNVVIISEVDYKLLQDKLNIVSKEN